MFDWHDRYFMVLWSFRGKGEIISLETIPTLEPLTTTSETPKKKKKDWKNKTEKKPNYEEQRALKKLEKEIASLDAQKENLQQQFNDESLSPEDIKSLSIELTAVEKTLETKSNEWLERSLALE